MHPRHLVDEIVEPDIDKTVGQYCTHDIVGVTRLPLLCQDASHHFPVTGNKSFQAVTIM